MRLWFRKMVLSATASLGILAIANTETIYQDNQHLSAVETPYFAQLLKSQHHRKLEAKVAGAESPKANTPLDDLKEAFAKDELNDEAPLANLAAFTPLEQIFRRGVAHFERKTWRSSKYKSEAGYDRILYKIESPKGEISYIVNAALQPDQISTLIIQDGQASTYLGSQCTDQSAVSPEQVALRLAQEVGTSVPFLAVAP